MASATLLPAWLPGRSRDHHHHPTAPQIILMPKGKKAHKAWAAEPSEPGGYGLGRKWASRSLCPRPLSSPR